MVWISFSLFSFFYFSPLAASAYFLSTKCKLFADKMVVDVPNKVRLHGIFQVKHKLIRFDTLCVETKATKTMLNVSVYRKIETIIGFRRFSFARNMKMRNSCFSTNSAPYRQYSGVCLIHNPSEWCQEMSQVFFAFQTEERTRISCIFSNFLSNAIRKWRTFYEKWHQWQLPNDMEPQSNASELAAT